MLDINDVEEICGSYERVVNKSLPVSVTAGSQELIKLDNCLPSYKTLLAEKSPKARLWLQYTEYIETFYSS